VSSLFGPGAKIAQGFAYDFTIDDLPNGLRVVTLPTDYPNLVALYIVVQTGSRNEPEKGKSGYAHLFEHLSFAAASITPASSATRILKKAGANDNAYTTGRPHCLSRSLFQRRPGQGSRARGDRFQV